MIQKYLLFRKLKKAITPVLGQLAVSHFTLNFRKQGFDDSGVMKWKDVKRRDPNSKWYGYRNGKFRKAATTAAILVESGALKNSVRVVSLSEKKISIGTNQIVKEYAKLHNEGGRTKSGAKVPQRKFIGKSRNLESKMKVQIKRELKTLFK
jgi:phage gpG-like protein